MLRSGLPPVGRNTLGSMIAAETRCVKNLQRLYSRRHQMALYHLVGALCAALSRRCNVYQRYLMASLHQSEWKA
jgi:hypothetical protein